MNNYRIRKRISDGAFGTVYQATRQKYVNNKNIPDVVAIKQVYSTSQHLKRQLKILKQLPHHPNLVQTYDVFDQNFTTSIVMQRGVTDLKNWMDNNYYPIHQNIIKNIAYQILKGVAQIHQLKIIHRDLKPSNLILTQKGQIAICDFGSATYQTKGQQYQLQGFTRWYKSPQMLFGNRTYKSQVDIWSVGCILMQLAIGQPLFNGNSEIEQLSLIAKLLGDPSPQNWPDIVKLPDYNKIKFNKIKAKTIDQISQQFQVNKYFVSFIMNMIKYQDRMTAKQLLNHQYLKNIKNLQAIPTYGCETRKIHLQLLQKAKKIK